MNTPEKPASDLPDGDGLRETAEAAYKRAKGKARALGDEAKEKVSDFAEARKAEVSESLRQFASAVERASEELQERDQTMAGQMVREAAGGLSHLSRSIGGASASDLVESVRDFGRRNPAAFIGGAVLAGLALGRFARSASKEEGRGFTDRSGQISNRSAASAPSEPRLSSEPGEVKP